MATTYVDSQEAEKLIKQSGQIDMYAFQVAIGVFTGLALCCFIIRMAIRLTYQKQLRLDDAFLIFAAACLCAATGILYDICYFLYLHSASVLEPEVLPEVLAHYDQLLGLQKKVYPFLALIWTTTYSVKGCFLAFMRPLIWHISRRVNRYYWFIAVFCVISWAYSVADPFIICPYFGLDAVQCFVSTVDGKKTLGLTALVTVLDIASDLMVVSVPIIVLQNSFLNRSTKFGLATFLCLSIFMAICAIVRIAGFYYRGLEDDTWEFFWQHTEGAVAVMMASITAFRTLFVRQSGSSSSSGGGGGDNDDGDGEEGAGSRKPIGSFLHRLLRRLQSLARAQPDEKPTPGGVTTTAAAGTGPFLRLPRLPSPIFTGMRTFVRRNNRTDATDTTFTAVDSVMDDAEAEYHAALKTQTKATWGTRETYSRGQSSGSA